MQFSTFRNKSDNKPQTVEVADWIEFAEWLNDFKLLTDKDGPGWSPATFTGTRAVSNVELISCLAFDIDENIDPEVFSSFECVMHTTYTPGRWRLVMCTSRPHTKQEHKVLWQRIYDRLEGEKHGFDDSCSDASRFYYLPAEQVDGAGQFITHSGEIIDVDKVLNTTKVKDFILPPKPSMPPQEPAAYDDNDIKTQARRGNHKELIQMLNEEPPAQGGRGDYFHKAFYQLYSYIPPLPTIETGRHLASRVLDKMDMPEGRPHWDAEIEKKLYAKRQFIVDRQETEKSIAKIVNEHNSKGKPVPEGVDWRSQLARKKDQAGNYTSVLSTGNNIKLILANDQAFKDLRYNLVFKRVEVASGPLQGHDGNTSHIALCNWLGVSEYQIKTNVTECENQLRLLIKDRGYDPVQEYLTSLPGWDTTPRISSFLRERCGVVDGSDEYVNQVSRKFFVSAVARAMDPGCQVDSMLILVGEGGAGKSTFVRKLGGAWASDVSIDLHSKDGQMAIARTWIMELSELASLRKSDGESLKAFITRTVDSFRPPYGKVYEDTPRRAVLVGTSNDEEIISDREGARRYWPVRVGIIDTAWIEENRDKLWAEALHAYAVRKEDWWFDRTGQKLVEAEQATFVQDESLLEEVRIWFARCAKDKRPTEVTSSQILEKLGYDMSQRMEAKMTIRMGRVLKFLGFQKRKAKREGLTTNVWFTPQSLLDGVQTKTGYTISPVPDIEKDAK